MACKCPKCNAVYNEGVHRPLLLPCGHTFCKLCVYRSRFSKCFDCQSVFSKDSLPTCFQLLPGVEVEKAKPRHCDEHKFPLLFWCKTCKDFACRECIVVNHKQCQLILTETHAMEEYAETHEDALEKLVKISNLKSTNKKQIDLLTQFIAKAVKLLRKLCERDRMLFDLQTVVKEDDKKLVNAESDIAKQAVMQRMKGIEIPEHGSEDQQMLEIFCGWQVQPSAVSPGLTTASVHRCQDAERSSFLNPDILQNSLWPNDVQDQPDQHETSSPSDCHGSQAPLVPPGPAIPPDGYSVLQPDDILYDLLHPIIPLGVEVRRDSQDSNTHPSTCCRVQ